MITLTAIITAKPGTEDKMRAELVKVGAFVRANELDTVSFFVTQDGSDPRRFVTHERFRDRAAMDLHNNGAGSNGFFAACREDIEGEVTVVVGEEAFER